MSMIVVIAVADFYDHLTKTVEKNSAICLQRRHYAREA
jgi:hypothetical protein